jgi:phage terminase small subunit
VAPSWLSGDALAEFNRVAEVLEGMGYLTPADAGVLAAYALAWAELCAAGRGEKPVTAAMLTSFRQLAGVLGLEPVSRSRIHTPKKAEPETGAWAGFGGGAR